MVRELYNNQLGSAAAFINYNYLQLSPRQIGTKVTTINREFLPSSETISITHQQRHSFNFVSGFTCSSVVTKNLASHTKSKMTLLAHQEQKQLVTNDEDNDKIPKKSSQQKDECNQNMNCGDVGIHWRGTVTARILPRDFEEFHLRKPSSQITHQDEKNALLSIYRQKPLKTVNNDNDSLTSSKDSTLINKDSDDSNDIKTDYSVVLDLELYCDKYCRKNNSLEGVTNGMDHPKRINLVDINLHLIRDANEKCTRTLQRLEISTAKKLKTLKRCSERMEVTTNDGQQTSQRSKKRQSRKQQKKKNQNSNDLKSFMFLSDLKENKLNKNYACNNDKMKYDYFHENKNAWDVSNLSSVELWRQIASSRKNYEENNQTVGLSLSCPNNEGELYEYPYPSSIYLDVISCPPTILSVTTFENFEAQVFVGVPLVVEVKLIFAIRSIITWFVNGLEVLRDSTEYTPTQNDVGKEISVLIIPLSKDYDDQNYAEAYRFVHLVENLPFMPIVSPMRDDWVGKRDNDSNHLRVLLTKSLSPEHHDCWKYLNEYQWDMEDSLKSSEKMTVSPPLIVLPSCFPNLLSGCSDMPSFTHLTTYFVDTLDYILASESSDKEPFGFQPSRSAQMPSEDEIRRYVAMPNEYMPSDHVSLVCDLKWKSNDHALDFFYSSSISDIN